VTNELMRRVTSTYKCDKFVKSITESETQNSLIFFLKTACVEIYVSNRRLATSIAIATNKQHPAVNQIKSNRIQIYTAPYVENKSEAL